MSSMDLVIQWFDQMPKSLKLLYIAKNPDCKTVMHHYRSWDIEQLGFYYMLTTTQHMLMREHEKLYP